MVSTLGSVKCANYVFGRANQNLVNWVKIKKIDPFQLSESFKNLGFLWFCFLFFDVFFFLSRLYFFHWTGGLKNQPLNWLSFSSDIYKHGLHMLVFYFYRKTCGRANHDLVNWIKMKKMDPFQLSESLKTQRAFDIFFLSRLYFPHWTGGLKISPYTG